MDKVQELLSDPESLKQIQELADILNSDINSSQPTQSQGDQTNSTSSLNNQDTNFQNNQTNNNQSPQDDNSNGFDFGMIFQLMQLFNNSSNSQDTTLLLAIKPYLSVERQSKVDKAIKLMKIYDIFTIAKDSGLLNNLDSFI